MHKYKCFYLLAHDSIMKRRQRRFATKNTSYFWNWDFVKRAIVPELPKSNVQASQTEQACLRRSELSALLVKTGSQMDVAAISEWPNFGDETCYHESLRTLLLVKGKLAPCGFTGGRLSLLATKTNAPFLRVPGSITKRQRRRSASETPYILLAPGLAQTRHCTRPFKN